MRRRIIVLLAAFTLIVSGAEAKNVGGAIVPETMKAGSSTILLNGAGVRTQFFMNIYIAALYLQEKTSDYNKIINANEPMAIRLHIVSRLVGKDTFVEKTNEGFKRSAGAQFANYKNEIAMFFNVFGDGIKKNNKYDLIYVPGTGTKIFKNGAYKVTVKGLNFKKVLFGIWLKPNCPLKDLRNGMLGK